MDDAEDRLIKLKWGIREVRCYVSRQMQIARNDFMIAKLKGKPSDDLERRYRDIQRIWYVIEEHLNETTVI